ncbi:sugar transferase [Marimonas sp. MJW-29]|uniref:Sugar transferase n=1 Tax=Sulfitobacter sediminis TaxID=3234186 RepID=A0ABV3RN81_9RHOB
MKHETLVTYGGPFAAVRPDRIQTSVSPNGGIVFLIAKRMIDVVFAVLALPILLLVSLLIFFANQIWNPGPLFYRQMRMGRAGEPFKMWKFRTMIENGGTVRAANAPLEEHRITRLGRLLRRTKIDELPNILNIFTGDMSLVGPRPDAYAHATEYIGRIPRYRMRYAVRPGITGLAQVRGGYADTSGGVKRKAHYDSFYIRHRSIKLELYIIVSTIRVVFSGFGQR